jgi:hypothetical protein
MIQEWERRSAEERAVVSRYLDARQTALIKEGYYKLSAADQRNSYSYKMDRMIYKFAAVMIK